MLALMRCAHLLLCIDCICLWRCTVRTLLTRLLFPLQTIFKMYQMHRSCWCMDDVRLLPRKTDGKGVMYAVFKDEISGLGFNQFTEERWLAFEAYRKTLDNTEKWGAKLGATKYPRPAMWMHEYGKDAEGYWTAEHMVALTKEFVLLFEWTYPGCEMGLLVDYSSNHSAVAKDTLALQNMNVKWGGKGNQKLKPKKLPPGVVNTAGQSKHWKKQYKKRPKELFVFVAGDPPPFEDDGAVDYIGHAIGLKELLYRRGWWKPGMTFKGPLLKPRGAGAGAAAAAAAAATATVWKKGDLVMCVEMNDDEQEEKNLYRVISVDRNHEDVTDDHTITLRYFNCVGNVHTLSAVRYEQPASVLTDVPFNKVHEIEGQLSKRALAYTRGEGRLVVEVDLDAYHSEREAEARAALEDEAAAAEVDVVALMFEEPQRNLELSMQWVALNKCAADMANVPSMLEEVVREAGHTLIMSPKYHAELAGQGIEYDFGSCKHYYRNYPRASKKGMVDNSLASFSSEAVPLWLTRKHARKARDYQRTYRGKQPTDDLEQTESVLKEQKVHRSALDSHSGWLKRARDNPPPFRTYLPSFDRR